MKRLWMSGIRFILMLTVALLSFDAVVIGFHYPMVGVLGLVAVTWRKVRRGWPVSDAFGSARFADFGLLIRRKLLCDKGLILGKAKFTTPPTRGQSLRSIFSPLVTSEQACRQFFISFLGSRWCGDVFIRVSSFTHLLTVAPAGGGKSVNTLIPNLLSYAGNCVVVDPKGELYNLTANHRRKRFGHKIVRLDPALLCGPGASTFNPFDFIDTNSDEFIDMCRDLADMIVVRSGKEIDPHWPESAANVITAFIAFICACEGDPDFRNLRGMRMLLASREHYENVLEIMSQREEFQGILQQLGNQLGWHVDRELGSVMTNVNRHTNIFESPLVAKSTNLTSFNPSELRTGKMTVYLVIPANRLVVWSGLQRLWIGSLIRIITRGDVSEKNPVLFLVDEAAHIGKVRALEDAITLMRGMGIRVWLFFQSIEQLQKCFGENASTVLDNLGTQQYFAITSFDTAEILSKRIGETTIRLKTTGDNDGGSRPIGGTGQNQRSRNWGSSNSYSEAGRRLLKPEEILMLSDHVGLVFHQNNPVILAQRIRWYSDRAFRRKGVGKSRGVGLGGLLVALLALLFSGVCTAIAVNLPGQNSSQQDGGGFRSFLNPPPDDFFADQRPRMLPPPPVVLPPSRPDFLEIPPPRRRYGQPVPPRSTWKQYP
jgi:type IV secretion system protein VirD4